MAPARRPPSDEEPRFFATAERFAEWLAAHHAEAPPTWIGFHKKGSGRPSMTWPESVDEALCVGWIDGLRRGLDGERYMIRFGPRKPGSTWSAINVRRVEELTAQGRMRPAGLAAFARRNEARTAIYSYERRHLAALDDDEERRFRADAEAWRFFEARPPSYRRTALHWVVSCKRAETRRRRLDALIADSARGELIKPLRRPPKRAAD